MARLAAGVLAAAQLLDDELLTLLDSQHLGGDRGARDQRSAQSEAV